MNRPRFSFLGTPLALTESESYHLRKYWKKGRQTRTILPLSSGVVEVDREALATRVQLDCARCHLAHVSSCCEGGFPFPPPEAELPLLEQQFAGIQEWLPPAAVQHVAAHGLFASHVETAGYRTIGTLDGNCLFCQVEEQGPACMAHRYALQAGISPEQAKPLSCLLYPLDLIYSEEEERVLLTALTERTAAFSRWGSEYRSDYLCANVALRQELASASSLERTDLSPNLRRAIAADVFPLAAYHPAYQAGQSLLTSLYGATWYDELHTLMQGGRTP